MKKLFALLAACMLLLVGCGGNKTEETTPTAEQPSAEITIPTGVGEAVVPEEGDISIEIG